MSDNDWIKQRRLRLTGGPEARPERLLPLLRAQDGMREADWQAPHLHIHYDLRRITLQRIVALLPERDYRPDGQRLWLQWQQHLEQMQLTAESERHDWIRQRRQFHAAHWQQRRHGRVDYRRHRWQDYQQPEDSDG